MVDVGTMQKFCAYLGAKKNFAHCNFFQKCVVVLNLYGAASPSPKNGNC